MSTRRSWRRLRRRLTPSSARPCRAWATWRSQARFIGLEEFLRPLETSREVRPRNGRRLLFRPGASRFFAEIVCGRAESRLAKSTASGSEFTLGMLLEMPKVSRPLTEESEVRAPMLIRAQKRPGSLCAHHVGKALRRSRRKPLAKPGWRGVSGAYGSLGPKWHG